MPLRNQKDKPSPFNELRNLWTALETTIIVIYLQSCLKYFIRTIEDVRDKEEPEPFAKKENWNEQKENCKKQKEKLEWREEKKQK